MSDEEQIQPPVRCWDIWVVYLRVFLAKFEISFEKYGRLVAKHPWKVIGICLLIVTACCCGFANIQTESRADRLFVPENSPSERALKAASPYFSNLVNTREAEAILIPKNGSNIITPECMKEVINITRYVLSIDDYDKVCLPKPSFLNGMKQYDKRMKCSVLSPAELLKRVSSIISLSKQLARANKDVTKLMSNGRAPIYNLKMMFAGLEFKKSNVTPNKPIATAKGVRLIFYLKESKNKDKIDEVFAWEDKFLKGMEQQQKILRCANLYYTSARSLDDSIKESSSSDIILISITFAIMISFACSMMGKYTNPVRGHSLLSLAGIFSTAIGIAAGLGLAAAFKVPFISLVGVMPFLVLSIGIDDMFIIVDDFDRTSRNQSPTNRVADSLSRVGSTITMTTITDVAAFIVSMQTSFPAIRYFCIYAAACITLEFVLQISFFIGVLVFDARRIESSRMDCLPILHAEDKNKCHIPEGWSFSDKFMRFYTRKILSIPGKVIIILLLAMLLAGGIYGSIHVNKEFSRKSLAKEGSYYNNYISVFERLFPQTIPVNLQVTTKIDYSDAKVQQELLASPKLAQDTGYYMPMNFSWMHFYKKWADTSKLNTTGSYFNSSFNAFLDHPYFRQHNVDVVRDRTGSIVASRILVFMKDNSSSNFQRDAMLTLRDSLKTKLSIPLMSVADPFIFFEQYASVVQEVTKNLMCASLVILFFITPFCVHPLLILMIVFGFVSLIVNLFGLMYFWNVSLDAISMINLVMSIGFAVDYSAHIAHAFITSKEKEVDSKIEDALVRVGTSVVMGGLSTFLGMLTTAFATSHIFRTFFKMFFGIVVFGLFNGICVLPVLLSLFGSWMHTNVNTSTSYIVSAARQTWERITSFSKKPKEAEKNDVGTVIDKPDSKQVSVVGISARFPTAKNKSEFWDLLVEGRDTITDYPKNREARFQYFEDYYNPTRPVAGRLYVSKGSYMEDIELFDYKFFGISATEAKSMDPQQRLLLQGTYEAMEDAGVKLDDLQRCTTGVYVGIMNLDYSSIVLRDDVMLAIDQFASTGTAFSIAANRISFSLNLTGPSIAIDTACSSSFSALSMACDHLRDGKCDVALVCAANLILCPKKQVTICRANMLSPDGKCKVFGDEADGYGRGEGCLVLVLKRRDQAVHSNDDIYGDIISWGVNNDGQTAAPMTAPSEEGQKMLLVDILHNAGVSPKDVQYVEMHGTGTIIGDMVETKSVGEIYGKLRPSSKPLRVGSVKSNINHTESAAGLAGLAKVCLMMKNQRYIATVNVMNLNPRLTLSEKNMQVQDRYETWPENDFGLPRLASVNSFGYGGSNAHFVVKEAVSEVASKLTKSQTNDNTLTDKKRVFVLSARCRSSLVQTAERFSKWFMSLDDRDKTITDVMFSTAERRTEHSCRVAIGFHNLQTASTALQDLDERITNGDKNVCYGQTTNSSDKTAFVFGGQGSQWRGMGADLLQDSFIKQVLFKIDYIAKSKGHNESVFDYLSNAEEENDTDNMVTTQLSIFAIEYAVSQLLSKRAGIHPVAVGGHSLGDITAACVSGCITLKEAILIIMARAGLQSKCQSNGAMAAAGLSIEEAKEVLDDLKLEDNVAIAAENDKKNITYSGDQDAIDKLDEYFTKERPKVFWRKLKVDKAFHSHHMEDIKAKFMKKMSQANIRPRAGQIKMISSVEGKEITYQDMDVEYWWRNLRNAVLFNQCAKGLLDAGCTLLLEISPRPVLSHYMNNIIKQTGYDSCEEEIVVMEALPRIKETERYNHLLVQCIGRLYTLGYPVDWRTLMDLHNGTFIRYPPYAWNETPLWSFDMYANYERTMTLLGKPIKVKSEEKSWQNEIDTHSFPYLDDHTMKAAGCILPGAAYLEMVFEAALEKSSMEPVVVKDLSFYNILPLPKQVVRIVRTSARRSPGSTYDDFEVANITETSEIRLASASFKAVPNASKEPKLTLKEAFDLGESRSSDRSSSCGSSSDSGIMTARNSDDNDHSINGGATHHDEKCDLDSFDQEMNDLKDLKSTFDDVMTAEEFNELATQTGFDFGESFRLIERAWCSDEKALVKIGLSSGVRETLGDYVIHPSIIDATLQACIAIKSTDREKPVIPIGIEKIRLCTPVGPITSLYAYTEVNKSIPDSCDLRLIDNNGNVLLHIFAFKVKDLRRALRFPKYDMSIYKIGWVPYSLQVPKKMDSKRQWLVIGVSKSTFVNAFLKALNSTSANEESIKFLDVKGSESVENFEENLLEKVKEFDSSEVVVANLLPCIAQNVECIVSQALSTQWLSFESTLSSLKALVKCEFEYCKLLAITSGSQAQEILKGKEGACVPWASTVWGLARVTNQEQGKVPTICVDVGLEATDRDFEEVIKYLESPDAYEGFAVYGGLTYVPEFRRVARQEESQVGCQIISKDNDFYVSWSHEQNSFALKQWIRSPELKSDELEVIVHCITSAVGEIKPLLDNAKDTFARNIPYCFYGLVSRVGADVTSYEIGDEIIGINNSRWLQNIIRVSPSQITPNNAAFSPEQEVSLAFCYSEAYELISKIQVCIPKEGKIFMVASPKHWGFYYAVAIIAKAQGYDVTVDERLCNSRYKDIDVDQLDIQQIYRESLRPDSSLKNHFDCLIYPAGSHILDTEAYVNILHHNGCLVALHQDGDPDTKAVRLQKNVTLLNVSLSKKEAVVAEKVLPRWSKCVSLITSAGLLEQLLSVPYVPMTVGSITENHFESRIINRDSNSLYSSLVFSNLMDEEVRVIQPSLDTQGLKEDRTYVVIGGAKGLGLDTVRWMASRGAGTIITVSRSDPPEEVELEFKNMREKIGAHVFHVKGNISDASGISALEEALDKCNPLAGIINSAVILDDKIFTDVDRENYSKVMGPKLCGTVALHNMTERRKDELDFFVMYSSITSVLGNIGQTTYSASNAFMNSFAEYRQNVLGKPCLSVCWGAMGGTGILERDFKTAAMLESRGLHLLHIKEGLEYLERMLTTKPSQSCVSICDIEWKRYLRGQSEKRLGSPFLRQIQKEIDTEEDESHSSLLELLRSTKSVEKQRDILRQFIARWLAAWIGGSEEEIDMNVPLFTYGIDSVGASAIKAEIEKELEISMEVFHFMQAETTGNKLTTDLLKLVRDKISGKVAADEADDEMDKDDEDDGDGEYRVPKQFLQKIFSPPGASANFFCIHPSHRYTGILLPIAQGFKFQKIFNMFTIGAQDPAYMSEDYESVHNLAIAYLRLIKKEQPFGPYFIGGYSFGGLISLEIASILTERGENVELVVMLDTVRWIPKGRNNSQMLLEMYQEDSNPEMHIQAQLLSFMVKIATLQLGIRVEDFDEIVKTKTFEEIVDILNHTATEKEKSIPDLRGIYESTANDQILAGRCHEQWEPSKKLYKGHVLYIHAEDDEFCKAIPGLGSAVDCWRTVLDGEFDVIGAPGNHYTMLNPGRASDVGHLIATAALIRYRRIYPNLNKWPTNNCQQVAVRKFRQGIEMILYQTHKRGGVVRGTMKISRKLKKLKFKSSSPAAVTKVIIPVRDVLNIVKISTSDFPVRKMRKQNSYSSLVNDDLYAGVSLRCDKERSFNVIAFNRQDYMALVATLREVLSLPLPLSSPQ